MKNAFAILFLLLLLTGRIFSDVNPFGSTYKNKIFGLWEFDMDAHLENNHIESVQEKMLELLSTLTMEFLKDRFIMSIGEDPEEMPLEITDEQPNKITGNYLNNDGTEKSFIIKIIDDNHIQFIDAADQKSTIFLMRNIQNEQESITNLPDIYIDKVIGVWNIDAEKTAQVYKGFDTDETDLLIEVLSSMKLEFREGRLIFTSPDSESEIKIEIIGIEGKIIHIVELDDFGLMTEYFSDIIVIDDNNIIFQSADNPEEEILILTRSF